MKQVNVTFPVYDRFSACHLLPIFQKLHENAVTELKEFSLDPFSAGAVDISLNLLFVLFSRNPEFVIQVVNEEIDSPEMRHAIFGLLNAIVKTYANEFEEEADCAGVQE